MSQNSSKNIHLSETEIDFLSARFNNLLSAYVCHEFDKSDLLQQFLLQLIHDAQNELINNLSLSPDMFTDLFRSSIVLAKKVVNHEK